jgi:hypothetical protein
VLRFADASRLQVVRARHRVNGTSYEYRCVDAKGAATFSIAGRAVHGVQAFGTGSVRACGGTGVADDGACCIAALGRRWTASAAA